MGVRSPKPVENIKPAQDTKIIPPGIKIIGPPDVVDFAWHQEDNIERAIEYTKAKSKATDFYLTGNNFGDHIAELCEQIAYHKSIRKLCFDFNNIGPNGAKSLVKIINSCNLDYLDIGCNPLGDEGIEEIAKAIGSNNTITKLFLRDCNMGTNGVIHLSNTIKINSKLDLLAIRENNINEESMQIFADALPHNTTLIKLHLQEINAGSKGMKLIANALTKNTHITHLYLAGNNIDSKGVKALSQQQFTQKISYNKNIINLSEDEHREDTSNITEISPLNQFSLKKFSITHIFLENNPIKDDGAIFIADFIKNNSILKQIDLENCDITDEGAKCIAKAIENHPSLTLLNLMNNAIGDIGKKAIEDARKIKDKIYDDSNLILFLL